jgi:hypothetical protein
MHEEDERRPTPPMSVNEETHWLEAELERSKHDLQEDLTQIENKLQRTRTRLRPSTFLGDNALIILSISFAVGFALGYWDVPIRDIGKPVARTMLTTVGRQLAVRAIRG